VLLRIGIETRLLEVRNPDATIEDLNVARGVIRIRKVDRDVPRRTVSGPDTATSCSSGGRLAARSGDTVAASVTLSPGRSRTSTSPNGTSSAGLLHLSPTRRPQVGKHSPLDQDDGHVPHVGHPHT